MEAESDSETSLCETDVSMQDEAAAPNKIFEGKKPKTAESDDTANIKMETENVPSAAESTEKSKEINIHREALQAVISDLYMNVPNRMRLIQPPKCVEFLYKCASLHSDETPIKEIGWNTKEKLRLNTENHSVFIDAFLRCIQQVYHPGQNIFIKFFDFILSFNKDLKDDDNDGIFDNMIHLITDFLRTFPPCWSETDTYYRNLFLNDKLEEKCLYPKRKFQLPKSTTLVEVILELFENELQNPKRDGLEDPNIKYTLQFHERQVYESQQQSFEALDHKTRIYRLCLALAKISEILEWELVMWIMRYHENPKESMETNSTRTFVADIFGLNMNVRRRKKSYEATTKNIFRVFALAVRSGLEEDDIEQIERLINVIVTARITADVEATDSGIKLPSTFNSMLTEVYDVFLSVNPKNEHARFLTAIDIFRNPNLRCDFIRCFLQSHGFPECVELNPATIRKALKARKFLKSCARAPFSRAKYFKLLLLALQDYCHVYAFADFVHMLLTGQKLKPFKTRTLIHQSVRKEPSEAKLDMNALVVRGESVDVNSIKVHVDDGTVDFYFKSLTNILLLKSDVKELCDSSNFKDVDFKAWSKFLDKCVPVNEFAKLFETSAKDLPTCSNTQKITSKKQKNAATKD